MSQEDLRERFTQITTRIIERQSIINELTELDNKQASINTQIEKLLPLAQTPTSEEQTAALQEIQRLFATGQEATQKQDDLHRRFKTIQDELAPLLTLGPDTPS